MTETFKSEKLNLFDAHSFLTHPSLNLNIFDSKLILLALNS